MEEIKEKRKLRGIGARARGKLLSELKHAGYNYREICLTYVFPSFVSHRGHGGWEMVRYEEQLKKLCIVEFEKK